jgi:large subunit ribosomal protein L5
MARLQQRYKEEICPALMQEFSISNRMAVPRIEKVVVSMGVGRATQERKCLEDAMRDLSLVTGQKPCITRAKKSVSNFKLRKGMEIGCKVTLRGARMYEFLDRLVNVAMPRIRDFRGVGTDFDTKGNYNVGVRDLGIFPEVDLDSLQFQQGLNVTMVIAKSDPQRSRRLLELIGLPFRR